MLSSHLRYQPFLREWHAALGGAGLLVLRVEDLIDRPAEARGKLLAFLGLAGAVDAAALPPPDGPYARLHAGSLRAAKAAEPMRPATRALAEAFYKPHNDALAALLGDPSLTWPQGSTVVDAAALAATGLGPRASPLACDSALAG